MSASPSSCFLPLVLTLLVGCSASPLPSDSPTGSVRLSVSTPTAAPPGEVTRVTVTVSGSDMTARSITLALADGAWGGVIGDIPAGTSRTFLAQAFNASSTLRYEGRAENVTVTAGSTGLVSQIGRAHV